MFLSTFSFINNEKVKPIVRSKSKKKKKINRNINS